MPNVRGDQLRRQVRYPVNGSTFRDSDEVQPRAPHERVFTLARVFSSEFDSVALFQTSNELKYSPSTSVERMLNDVGSVAC